MAPLPHHIDTVSLRFMALCTITITLSFLITIVVFITAMEFFKRIRQSLRLLHLVTLGTRLWGLLWGRPGRSEGVDGGKGNGTGNRSGDDKGWDVAPRDVDVKLRGARLSVGLSMVSQGESGLKKRRRGSKADSSDEQNNNKKNESGDYGSKAEAAWHEALLECLVP